MASYELSHRMQMEVPEIPDPKGEKEATLEAYGVGKKDTDAFGRCPLYTYPTPPDSA